MPLTDEMGPIDEMLLHGPSFFATTGSVEYSCKGRVERIRREFRKDAYHEYHSIVSACL